MTDAAFVKDIADRLTRIKKGEHILFSRADLIHLAGLAHLMHMVGRGNYQSLSKYKATKWLGFAQEEIARRVAQKIT